MFLEKHLLTTLEPYKLQQHHLAGICDEDVFDAIVNSTELSTPCLGFSDSEIEDITKVHSNSRSQSIALLQEWKKCKESEATYLELCNALISSCNSQAAQSAVEYIAITSILCAKLEHAIVHCDKVHANWHSKTKAEQDDTKSTLLDKNEHVRRKYAITMTKIAQSFQNRKIEVLEVSKAMQIFFPVHVDVFKEWNTCTDVFQLFLIVANSSSWLNYHMLEHIVTTLGNETEKRFWLEYKNNHLNSYTKVSLLEVPEESLVAHSVMLQECRMSDMHSKYCVSDVLSARDHLAKKLAVLSVQVIRYDYNVKGIYFIFGIPKCVFEASLSQFAEWIEKEQLYMIKLSKTITDTVITRPEVACGKLILQKY